ncbi:hypothetical protein B0I35DRAFT_441752, partial [Stachybotrys elegans]
MIKRSQLLCLPNKRPFDLNNPILSGCGLDNDCWITWDRIKTFWLPVNFRPTSQHSLAISESRVGIGSASGRVTF